MREENKILLILGIVSAVIIVGAVFILSRGGNSITNTQVATNPQNIIRSDSYHEGSSSAKVTVVEFGDYQCPACGQAYPITKQMLSDYSSRINFVFRNFPLPQHQNAMIAAEAAEAAGAQNKFWQMHDKLYETQNDWSESSKPLDMFNSYAKDLGLDLSKFDSEVTSNKYQSKIQQDIDDGNSLSIDATPTFFINGEKTTGVPSYDSLKQLLDSDLAK